MSHSRRTLSLVTMLLIFGALGAGVVWRLMSCCLPVKPLRSSLRAPPSR